MQDWDGLFEGACITEAQHKSLYYLDKSLYEPITEEGKEDWIEVDEPNYCEANGLKCLLFYDQSEVDLFLKKLKHVTSSN